MSNVLKLTLSTFGNAPWYAALLLSGFIISPVSVYTAPVSNRALVNIDTAWKFNRADAADAQTSAFNDAAWTTVNLPHTWNNLDGQDGGSNYYRGVGWYRKHFTVSGAYAGRTVYIKFDGVNQVADVYVNGTFIGEHKGGFAAFCFDVSSAVISGADNVLAVKVTNAANASIPPLSADFTFFGGIYRDVNILVTDKLAVTALDYGSPGVYCKTPAVNAASATIIIVSKVRNANSAPKTTAVTTIIADASGATVATLTGSQSIPANSSVDVMQSTTISTPHLWNGLSDPYLYRVFVQVSDGNSTTDVVEQPLGLRFFGVNAATGFSLNGAYLDLHGVNRHQDWLDSGWATAPAQHFRDIALLREMGCTALRLSHYQHAEYFYDLCDSVGMVVWAEIPVVNGVTVSDSFYANAKQQMTELIRQNYNHPSIFIWGVGNEVSSNPNPVPLFDTLHRLCGFEDSSRLTTYASNTKNDTSATNALNWRTDLTGFNQYFGWYSDNGPLSAFAGWADRMHAVYPTRCIGISEYGAGSSVYQHMDNPPAPDPYGRPHFEEYENLCHETYWTAMKTRQYFWCKFIWCMHDFAVDGRNEGDGPGRNDKGLMTYDRQIMKDAFYFYKANWAATPVVYICSRRAGLRDATPVTLKVYSNCPSVELFVNGVSKGVQSSTNDVFAWSGVALPDKYNLVKAVGTKNGATYADSVRFGNFSCPDAALSQGKTASASSFQTGYAAANAVDGNSASTRWAASDAMYPQWWQVDLGSSMDIGCVRIKWYEGTDYRNYYYTIAVSDQASSGFTTVADCSKNRYPGPVENLVSGRGRYVRITVTGAVPLSSSSASIWEVKIYGPDLAAAQSQPLNTHRPGFSIRNSGLGVFVDLGAKAIYSLRVVDLGGKTMFAADGADNTIVVPAKKLPRGLYLLQVQYGAQSVQKRVLRVQ